MATTDEIRARRTHPAATAPLILFGLLFVGLAALGAAADAVPHSDGVLARASAFYIYTLLVGLLLSLLVFGAAGLILRKHPDPRKHWLRIGLMLALVLTAATIVCGPLGSPAVALGIAAIALGWQIALLSSAPQTRTQTWTYCALLGVALLLIAVSGWWVALGVQAAVSAA